MSVLSEAFRISMGTPTIYKIVEFFQNYRTSKQISTDEENPTEVDYFNGYECEGFNVSKFTSGTYYYDSYYSYGTGIVFDGITFSGLYLDTSVTTNAFFRYKKDGVDAYASVGTKATSCVGFIITHRTINGVDSLAVSIAYVEQADGKVYSTFLDHHPTSCTETAVEKKSEASIDLDTWNTNIDWIDELIESGDDTYISIDSDSYEEVSDPEELADTIMDAITDNDYEGTIAESPEPISYAATVKAALDDLDLKVNDTTPIDVITTIPTQESLTGIEGQIAYNSNYIYVCIATDTWKRAALGSW